MATGTVHVLPEKYRYQVLGEGWASPLSGFMRERQYLQVLHWGSILDLKHKTVFPGEEIQQTEDEWHLQATLNQSIPIVLPINDEQKVAIMPGTGGRDGLTSPA